MFKIWITIKKDFRLLTRDKVGLALMFGMPILLVIVITSVQNSTFELVNNNKVSLLLCNKDSGQISAEFVQGIEKIGMFQIYFLNGKNLEHQIIDRMHAKNALVAIVIPDDFSQKVSEKANYISNKAIKDFGLKDDNPKSVFGKMDPITLYYHPVLQESFRQSIGGAIRSAIQLVESKQILKRLYFSINEKELPDSIENALLNDRIAINEIPVSRDGSRNIPSASQHNIPAWTIFAMFFIVISLGSSVVREKLNGSFTRLKTMPTSFLVALASKQFTYLAVTLLQAAVIFSIGIWFFPMIGLPGLNLPADKFGLLIVTVICGWCATNFAICIGVFAYTQEQANGFGAVSIVILAAIGGLLVPAFAMPASFQQLMKISPLHWCLEAYYGLFLEGGKLKDILVNILSLIGITALIQFIALEGLRRKNLI